MESNQHGKGGNSEALARQLRLDLEAEAAGAPAILGPLYRWLRETAVAGRPMPRWGRRPHFASIGKEIGTSAKEVGSRYGAVVNRWYPRFLAAFNPSMVQVPVPYAIPAMADSGTAFELRDPATRAALLQDLREARERQPDDMKLAFDFLIARAEMSSAIPTHGKRPNIRAIAGMMKVSYDTVRPFTEIFTFWLERFGGEPSNSHDRRRTLPGTELTGTVVPVGLLVKLMKQDLKKEENEQAHRLLSHLIKVAEGDRTVPRFNGRPARSRILADAGVETEFSPAAVKSVYDAWIEFFKISDHYSFQGVDGSVQERSVLEEEARQYVARLRADDLRPLLRDSRSPTEISFAAINRDLNREGRGIGSGGARRIILAYRAECAAHRGDDGMGERYGGRPPEEIAARTARRNALLEYCRKELAAGRGLPGRPGNPNFLDHDELERRFNKPGPSLAGDNRFATLLRALKPKFEPYDATLVPTTYGQLIAEVQAHRVPAGTAEASATVLRSRLKTAIEAYARVHHKDVTSLVADDFSEEAFGATVAAVAATQKVAKTFATDIGRVRSFLDKRKSDANDRNDFHTALANAVRGSGLSVAAVASETGASSGQLDHWIRRTQAPSAAHFETITRIELRLGLDEGELTGKIGTRPGTYGQWPTRLPQRIRAFLPDDFMEKDPDEVKAMIRWINENLIHQNSAFARTIADLQRKSHAKRKEQSPRPEEDDRNYQADVDADDEDEDVERFEEEDDETGVQSDAAKSALTSALENQLAHETRGLGATIVRELRELIVHMTSFIVTNRLRRPGSHWKHESTAPMRLSMLARFIRWQVDAEEDGGLGRDPSAVTLADLTYPPLVLAYLDHRVRRNSNSERSGKAPRFTGSDVDLLRTVRSLVDPEYGFVTNYEGMSSRSREDRRPLSEGSFIGLDGHVFGKDENKEADLKEQKSVGVRSRDPDIMPLACTNLRTREFREQCAFASKVYASAAQQIDTYAEAGRDPVEPIVGLLDSDAPMTTLLRQLALASHRTPPIEVDARLHHLHIRDLLLCRLFALTTLRQKNMRQITVTGPEPKLTKEVVTVGGKRGVKKEEERWTLEIHFAEFKNFRNTTLFGRRRKRQPYRKHLPDSHGLYKLLAYYLDVSRPYFVKRRQRGAAPNELFLSSTGKALSGPETWRAVSRFTARHVAWNPFRNEGVPKVMPFGCHAFRDVRATDILLNPRTANPYLEAALALQTSPGMIQAHYGVIRPERRTALDDHTFIDRENEAWRNIAEPDYG